MQWYGDSKDIFERRLFSLFTAGRDPTVVYPELDIEPYQGGGFDFYTDVHAHAATELFVPLEGPCLLEYRGRCSLVRSGEIAVSRAGALHREKPVSLDAPYRNAYLVIERNRVWFFVTSYAPGAGFRFSMSSPKLVLAERGIHTQLVREVERASEDFAVFFVPFLKTLYLYLYRNAFTSSSPDIAVDRASHWFMEINDYLRNHFMERDVIPSLCEHLGASESHVCTFVKRYMNTTLSTYANDLRIAFAKHLLLDSSRKVSDIAEEVGFSDQYYFCKVFRNLVGMPPTSYRHAPGATPTSTPVTRDMQVVR